MREHQIIINLKPEHFEEVQRMARAAGSKSIGLFVRQKLLSTLGLAGSSKPQESGELDSAELKLLTGELRRLHRELQIFLADSTPATSPQSTLPFPRAVQENFLADGAPLLPESEPLDEEIMEQPPLPYTSPLPPYTTPMPPPDEIHAFTEVDELENLAERAFAISPRLGALDEPQPKPFPDPLKELLNDAFLNTVQDDEEEQTAPSLEQEEQETAMAEELAQGEGEEEFAEEGAEEVEEEGAEEESVAQEAEEEEAEEEVAEEVDIEDDDKADDDENPDSESDNPPTPPAPPPTPPVISGGPPPRKRNT